MKHIYSSIFTVALFTLFAFNAYAQGPNDSGTYYQAADGKKGAELKTALCAIYIVVQKGPISNFGLISRQLTRRKMVKFGICIPICVK